MSNRESNLQRPFPLELSSVSSDNRLSILERTWYNVFSQHRILAQIAFLPEQIAEQVVEGLGGDDTLVQGKAKDGHKVKGDLEQWKVLFLT